MRRYEMGHWPPLIAVVASGADGLPLVRRCRARGWRVAPIGPPPDAATPAALARAVAAVLEGVGPDVVIAAAPPWWLGVAAQARMADTVDRAARWLLIPAPDSPAAPARIARAAALERAALDRMAREAADWIGAPTVPADARLPDADGDGPPDVRCGAGRAPVSLGVVLVHRDRPDLAARALASLTAQTRPPDALAVVDAASTDPEAVARLGRTVAGVSACPARMLTRDSASLGAARAAGAAVLGTDWLLFMDDDNMAPPEALATFARAAATGRADIWTCWARLFRGAAPSPAAAAHLPLYAPLGPVPGLMARDNDLGDANLLIRRTAFDALGGFDPDPDTGAEDWDLLVRAWTAGLCQRVIPRVLVWKRETPGSMSATMDRDRARARIVARLRAAGVPA
jgi:GT2 family glycosyltransferase